MIHRSVAEAFILHFAVKRISNFIKTAWQFYEVSLGKRRDIDEYYNKSYGKLIYSNHAHPSLLINVEGRGFAALSGTFSFFDKKTKVKSSPQYRLYE